VQHFFVARLEKLDEAARSGPEFQDASRGGYDLERIGLRGDDRASVDLKPTALKEFVLANRGIASRGQLDVTFCDSSYFSFTRAGPPFCVIGDAMPRGCVWAHCSCYGVSACS
jgi:hypothetical protein